MPTSSQSKILSVVDYQLLQQQQQQQQSTGHEGTTIKPSSQAPVNQISVIETKRRRSKDDRPSSIGRKDEEEEQSPSSDHWRSSAETNEKKFKNVRKIQKDFRRAQNKLSVHKGTNISRTSQRNDVLHVPIINLNTKTNIKSKTSVESPQYRRSSVNTDHPIESGIDPILIGHNSSVSDVENLSDDEENDNVEQRSSLLNDSARRLLVLGTIRPSKSFYRDLPASDIQHLMEYFKRMRKANRKISSEEINQELITKSTEYKPKIFYDSASVTKSQVNSIEKFIEPYAEQIRTHQVELIQLDNPMRFSIKPIDNDKPLITIPREFNDCLLALISRSDPLRKSDLITELIPDKISEDVKANSLDISYFPGGVNYDVPCEEIDENGQMKIETYQKLKNRLNTRKVWYFTGPPEKKPHALIAIIPSYVSTTIINHQRLLDCLYDRLKTSSNNDDVDIEQRILSIEFVPLSCVLDSHEISDQFIIDCDSNETKQQLMDKPLKLDLKKQSITIELQSYDENMQKEYNKSIKAERYQELIKNHDAAVKRTSNK